MAEKVKKDREPWSPRIESDPLFINSADFERGLGEASKLPDIEDEGVEEDEELEDPATPNPFIKPAG
ncbi:MAG TPA: hypothetical protein VK727_20550 [Steroidobacteraceae bacterium]|jgi:hypothetical protein|nr:hypothetical protein [Steroidobacteraceae bacterium]